MKEGGPGDTAGRHNQAGLHRGIGLSGFLDAIPYEPTVPFDKLAGDQAGPTSEFLTIVRRRHDRWP